MLKYPIPPLGLARSAEMTTLQSTSSFPKDQRVVQNLASIEMLPPRHLRGLLHGWIVNGF